MNVSQTFGMMLVVLSLSGCNSESVKSNVVKPVKVTVTTVQTKDVTLTQQYVGKINAHLHLTVRVPQTGIIESAEVKEGQAVKQYDPLFRIRTAAATAENDGQANPYPVRATFDGQVGRIYQQQGSTVKSGETLTTLSDSSQVNVVFNVSEAQYLAFHAENPHHHFSNQTIELLLANGSKFDHLGKLKNIGVEFHAKTGNVPFRADFPNPDRLLRHGQDVVVLISELEKDALVIPQRALFEYLGKRYVYLVDENDVAQQCEIEVEAEIDDLFVIEQGLSAGDRIVVEGVRLLRGGEKVEYSDSPTTANLK